MLSDPQIGMRVRWLGNRIGTITSLQHIDINIVYVKLDINNVDIFYALNISAYLDALEKIELSIEEQEQERRKNHADKYL